MVGSDVNLLPESVLEELRKKHVNREKLYFLISIAVSLAGATLICLGIIFFLSLSVKGSQQLLDDQTAKLDQLNDLWNSLLQMQVSADTVLPLAEYDVHLVEVWGVVSANLRSLELIQIQREDEDTFSIQAKGASPEESTQFLLDVGDKLSEGVVSLENIRQVEDEVFFTFFIIYN